MHLKVWKQNVQFMHMLSIPRFSCIHSDILRKKKTQRGQNKRKPSVSLFFPMRRSKTSSSPQLQQTCTLMHNNSLAGQKGCRLPSLTSNRTKARLHIFMETGNRERDHEHTCTGNLPLLWLPCLCPLSWFPVCLQKPLPIKGNKNSLTSSSRVLCVVCIYRRACLRAAFGSI